MYKAQAVASPESEVRGHNINFSSSPLPGVTGQTIPTAELYPGIL